jgi:hypothetical protein
LRFHALNADRVMLNLPLTVMLTRVSIGFLCSQNAIFVIIINTTLSIDRVKMPKVAQIFRKIVLFYPCKAAFFLLNLAQHFTGRLCSGITQKGFT